MGGEIGLSEMDHNHLTAQPFRNLNSKNSMEEATHKSNQSPFHSTNKLIEFHFDFFDLWKEKELKCIITVLGSPNEIDAMINELMKSMK